MILKNHIAWRFINDDDFLFDILETVYPKEFKVRPKDWDKDAESKLHSLYDLVRPEHAKHFFITNTVLDKLELLKIKKQPNGHFDWSVFKNIKIMEKCTFIFPMNTLMRMKVYENRICFFHCKMVIEDKKNLTGQSYWGNVSCRQRRWRSM